MRIYLACGSTYHVALLTMALLTLAQLTLATLTKVPTPLEHRLRALPFLARNVGLVASATHVWVMGPAHLESYILFQCT